MKETGLTGKRRSTTIAATPDDGNSQRKRRRRRTVVFGVFLHESARTAAKSRTNLSTNSVKAAKRLGRLAPNLAHMCKFIWEWIYAKQIAPRDTRGALGGF